jgi:acetyl esterase
MMKNYLLLIVNILVMKARFILVLLFASLVAIHPALAQEKITMEVLHSFDVVENVEWVDAGGIKLTMDIYTPKTGQSSYPVYVIYHGGGWLINNESIMDEMSRYMASHGGYVICNVNYRLLPNAGNTVTMNQIIEDAMGAVLWIKDNIRKYKGDPDRIAVSGDSAGGHLAAMVVLAGHRLESDGFAGPTLGFRPTYLPKGKTPEDIARTKGLAVQAAVLNYPAVDIYKACFGTNGDSTQGFESPSNVFWSFAQATPRGLFGAGRNVRTHAEMYKAVSPMYLVPESRERNLPPQLCAVGSLDNLTTPASVKEYADLLQKAGHKVEYWEHVGRPHAYLDSGSNQFLGTSFEKDAPYAIDRIIEFLDSVFR